MDKHLNNVDRTNSMTNIKFLNPKTIESDMTLPNFYKTPGNLKFLLSFNGKLAAIHKFNSQNTINLNGMEESTYTDLYRGDNNLNDSGKFVKNIYSLLNIEPYFNSSIKIRELTFQNQHHLRALFLQTNFKVLRDN